MYNRLAIRQQAAAWALQLGPKDMDRWIVDAEKMDEYLMDAVFEAAEFEIEFESDVDMGTVQ